MRLSALEANLHEARSCWKETIARDAPFEERLAADQWVLQAERARSLAQGEETALACEWVAPWKTGAPLPHIV